MELVKRFKSLVCREWMVRVVKKGVAICMLKNMKE